MGKKRYIHYGSNHFDPMIFREITNQTYGNKPHGGFWACPVDAQYGGWKDWCLCNDWKTENLDKSFKFTLSKNAKVLYLNEVISSHNKEAVILNDALRHSKAIRIPHKDYMGSKDHYFMDEIQIDFELLRNLFEYDAIEVTLNEFFYWKLYGWDVDSLLVMNPRVIVEV